MKTWLLIDSLYLAYKSHYSTGGLSFEGTATGVAFGFLRDIETQTNLHGATNFVFAFDYGGPGLRAEIDPKYKYSRYNKDLTDEELEIQKSFRGQVKRLRLEILPDMGYKNIFNIRGFEADDIIAQIANDLPISDEAIIITADEDLWQCLASNVRWHNPRSGDTITYRSFIRKWDIHPSMWSSVKAIAGCTTDDVKGIEGIGNKTAAKWYANKLNSKSKKYKAINDNIEVHNKNIDLVRLPFPGLELPNLREDEVTEQKKTAVEVKLGIKPKRFVDRKSRVKGFDI